MAPISNELEKGSNLSQTLHRENGPFSFLHPTAKYYALAKSRPGAADVTGAEKGGSTPDVATPDQPTSQDDLLGIKRVWRARDNRKGRHAIEVSPDALGKHGHKAPPATNSFTQTLEGLRRMVVRYPIWDVSYDTAVLFTLGSVIWVINGFFSWLPLQDPSNSFDGESSWGGGITAFIGATIFEVGSVFLMLEAVNEDRSECGNMYPRDFQACFLYKDSLFTPHTCTPSLFGWALEEAMESSTSMLFSPNQNECSHAHQDKNGLVKQVDGSDPAGGKKRRMWTWWPSWHELTTHYFREVGFLACLSQMIGATIFWIAGITSLPPILDSLSLPATNGVYWLPQVIGGTGFIISSWLFMLEVQPNWYTPAPKLLGWHIGFWNLMGAIGFTLCGALGFAPDNAAAAYATPLTSFIGSWSFLIGSVIQWYESLDKYPVVVEKGKQSLPGADSS